MDFLFEGRAGAARVAGWIAASPRYAAYAQKYKDKIRKKLRVSTEESAAAGLLIELQIPYLLLQEPRFEVAYEPYSAEKTGGPDFAVTYRAGFTFNIEVTHMRGPNPGLQGSPVPPGPDPAVDLRLVRVLCAKLRQLRPQMANLLLVAAASPEAQSPDLPAHAAWIKDRAERGDPGFYALGRFSNPSEFFKHYQRLSGLVFFHPGAPGQSAEWRNPQAAVSLPAPAALALRRALFGEGAGGGTPPLP